MAFVISGTALKRFSNIFTINHNPKSINYAYIGVNVTLNNVSLYLPNITLNTATAPIASLEVSTNGAAMRGYATYGYAGSGYQSNGSQTSYNNANPYPKNGDTITAEGYVRKGPITINSNSYLFYTTSSISNPGTTLRKGDLLPGDSFTTYPYAHIGPDSGTAVNLEIQGNNSIVTINSITATIGYSDGTTQSYTITDLPPDPTTLTVSGISVNESVGTAVVTISRSGDLSYPVSVTYGTVDQTAIAGSDYTAVSGTLTIPAGSNRGTINIPIISTPADLEGQEYFRLNVATNTQYASINTPFVYVYINSEIVSETGIFDLRRGNIHQLSYPTGEGSSDTSTGTRYTGTNGRIIEIHGGCNGNGGYYIVLNPKPPLVGFETVPGDATGFRHVYSDGSTRIFMQEYISETYPSGYYSVRVQTLNSNGTWNTNDFTDPSISTYFQPAGNHTLFVRRNETNGTVGVQIDNNTITNQTVSGDMQGLDASQTVFIACPGPPICVDQGFLGYIQGVTVDSWTDGSTIDINTETGGITSTNLFDTYRIIAKSILPPGIGFDTQRTISVPTEVVFDTVRTAGYFENLPLDTYRLISKTVNAITVEFTWDTSRSIQTDVEVPLDTQRDVAYFEDLPLDTYRLISRTVNNPLSDFNLDTERIISLTIEKTFDTVRTIDFIDIISFDTEREPFGTIDDVLFDTSRRIGTSDLSSTVYTVGFDTSRTIAGSPSTVVSFDTSRIITRPDPGLPDYSVIFDTQRTIINNASTDILFDTRRIINGGTNTIYYDTRRTMRFESLQTVLYDTKRRKKATFWEIPEYDE